MPRTDLPRPSMIAPPATATRTMRSGLCLGSARPGSSGRFQQMCNPAPPALPIGPVPNALPGAPGPGTADLAGGRDTCGLLRQPTEGTMRGVRAFLLGALSLAAPDRGAAEQALCVYRDRAYS